MSKGSKQRPSAVADETVADNWARIFNRPKEGDDVDVEDEDEEQIPEALIKVFENKKLS